jgi:hypothetical protein
MKYLLFLVCLTSQAFAYDVNLDRAEVIFEDRLEGSVNVWCRDDNNRTRTNYYNCNESVLRDGNYAKLVVSNGTIDADYVKLQRVGSKYIKGAKFNATTGISTGSFNLWVGSLFQRPMLNRGVNTIKYKFFKKKKLIAEGEFDVDVVRGKTRDCGYGTLSTSRCPSAYEACSEFYRRRNYCR